ncbi:MAG: XRE family transcriptional regulator [Betaproteobacteria bacterium HGW-Betaproteobacteria-22]|nr:MAG: XRE family transcriptional regulator [Betaproteobacteria bacterium HGW-Betaproteobacteria-22]
MSKKALQILLAKNTRALRVSLGYSQEQLAHHCGLHRTYIGSIERGEKNVTLNTLYVLAQAFGTTVPELLSEK